MTNQSPWSASVRFEKVDTDQRLAFGWLYQCKRADGSLVVDHSGEIIEIEELEKATYRFALESRRAGEMHKIIGVGRLVEVICFTPEKKRALGIPDGLLPDGTWVGFKIDDDGVWAGVKSGRYKMLSLGGRAIKEAL